MPVRAVRVELVKFNPETKARWLDLCKDVQRMNNRMWQIWLCHHIQNKSPEKLSIKREEGEKGWAVEPMGAAYKRAATRGKNKGNVIPISILQDSKDDRSIYRILAKEFPHVHSQVRTLLEKKWGRDLMKRKAANSKQPRWVCILKAEESIPTFTKPQPIPFSKTNSSLIKKDGKVYIDLSLEVEGRRSLGERCELVLGKRKCHRARKIVEYIIRGDFKWKGSSLVYDKGKWFVSLAYEIPPPSKAAINFDRVMYVKAGRNTPWRVSIGVGETWRFGGNGAHVENMRRAILRERASRKQHYRWAGSSQKGRGRARACAVWTKLSSRWKDFVKRYNNEVTKQLINLAVSRGCGIIVYYQPGERTRQSRFLSTVGNDETSNMSWDYFQVQTQLASKCEMAGIEFIKKDEKPTREEDDVNEETGKKRFVSKATKAKRAKASDAANRLRSLRNSVQSEC